MNSGSRPCAPRYLDEPSPPCSKLWLLPAKSPPPPETRAVAGVAALAGQLGDDLFDRAAGRELDHGERDRHDAEQRRDHQQDAAEDIGAHQRALAAEPIGLVAVEPPANRLRLLRSNHHSVDREAVVRLRLLEAEHVPERHAVIRRIPTWNPVHAGTQDPVERAHEVVSVVGRRATPGSRVEQRVDHRVLDAGIVARAGRVGRLRNGRSAPCRRASASR